MNALAEANADAREVDENIKIGGDLAIGAGEVYDEDELEEELKALAREAEEEKGEGADVRGKLERIGMEVPIGMPSKERAKVAA